MGQVVDISLDGQTKEMTQLPSEERAYVEHVSYQRQFEQERVAHGLEPAATGILSGGLVPVANNEPQSIYTEKFANLGLADFMQGILDEKKVEKDAEKLTQAQARPKANDPSPAQGSPSQLKGQVESHTAVYPLAQTMRDAPAETHTQTPHQMSQSSNGAPTQAGARAGMSGAQLTNDLSRLDISKAISGDSAVNGQVKSYWYALPTTPGQILNEEARGGAVEIKGENNLLPSGSSWW